MRVAPGRATPAAASSSDISNAEPSPPLAAPQAGLAHVLARGGALVTNVARPSDFELIEWARAAGRYTYIGRPSDWGNPYRIGRDGTRADVIARFEIYLRAQPELLARLPELRGRVLGCWCRPQPCHGGVLVRLLGEARP